MFIGFAKEYDYYIRASMQLSLMKNLTFIDMEVKRKVINYLENGTFLCGAMSYINDDENMPIGYLNYYTDGFYIWPSYYSYYLKKYPNFLIAQDFVKHVEGCNNLVRSISKEDLIIIEECFLKEWVKK